MLNYRYCLNMTALASSVDLTDLILIQLWFLQHLCLTLLIYLYSSAVSNLKSKPKWESAWIIVTITIVFATWRSLNEMKNKAHSDHEHVIRALIFLSA